MSQVWYPVRHKNVCASFLLFCAYISVPSCKTLLRGLQRVLLHFDQRYAPLAALTQFRDFGFHSIATDSDAENWESTFFRMWDV